MSGGKRIALLGLHLESNAFAPPTPAAAFAETCDLAGTDLLLEAAKPHPAMPAEMAAAIRAFTEAGPWIPAPLRLAAAPPGGPAEQGFVDAFIAGIELGLRQAGPVDGVYISAHGAMTAAEETDPDGALWQAARRAVGPGVPIVASVDLHCNLSDRMARAVDLVIGYRTNPHVDQAARGAEAARALLRLMGGAKWETARIRLPLIAPTVTQLTTEGPLADLVRAAEARLIPPLRAASVLGGFAFADAPHAGLTLYAASDRGTGAARRLVEDLAEAAWADRERFEPKLASLAEAVELARTAAQRLSPPILIADVADNPGGGAPGNTIFLAEALLQAGVKGAVVGCLHDPELAAEAHARGLRKRFNAVFNRGGHIGYTRRWSMEAVTTGLADGPFIGSDPGLWAGLTVDPGPSAALDLGGVRVCVVSRRIQTADPQMLTRLGVAVGTVPVIGVKSRGHFRAGFGPAYPADRIVEIDLPGITSPILARHKFQRLPRPVWPLDPDAAWTLVRDA